MNPLETATTEELVAELGRRHAGFVLATVRPANGNPRAERFGFVWGGSITLVVGLAHRALREAYAEIREGSEQCGEDD